MTIYYMKLLSLKCYHCLPHGYFSEKWHPIKYMMSKILYSYLQMTLANEPVASFVVICATWNTWRIFSNKVLPDFDQCINRLKYA